MLSSRLHKVIKYATGDVYDGDMLIGQYHGVGTMKYRKGTGYYQGIVSQVLYIV